MAIKLLVCKSITHGDNWEHDREWDMPSQKDRVLQLLWKLFIVFEG